MASWARGLCLGTRLRYDTLARSRRLPIRPRVVDSGKDRVSVAGLLEAELKIA